MDSRSAQSRRVSHVRLENWRNFNHVDVDLQDRVFLVGPNASGKSNFLDAFRFLQEIVSVGGGFQAAVQRRGGVSKLRCLSARRYSDIVVAVDLADESGKSTWHYELEFTQDNRQRPVIKSELVRREGVTVLERVGEKEEPELRTQTYLEQVQVNRDFRQVAEFFGSIRYMHIVPHLVREPDRSTGRINDPYGGDFLEQVAKTTTRTKQARLNRISEALKVAVPQLQELEQYRDEARGTPHLRARYQNWRASGAWQEETEFSDGTLRLLGLLWVLQEGVGPLLLEEPELSLHPEVVRYIPQMLRRVTRRSKRQVLLSTHSSDLLRDTGIGLDEVMLLEPTSEGTSVQPATGMAEVRALLEGGATLADAVIPLTRPANAQQLSLFEW